MLAYTAIAGGTGLVGGALGAGYKFNLASSDIPLKEGWTYADSGKSMGEVHLDTHFGSGNPVQYRSKGGMVGSTFDALIGNNGGSVQEKGGTHWTLTNQDNVYQDRILSSGTTVTSTECAFFVKSDLPNGKLKGHHLYLYTQDNGQAIALVADKVKAKDLIVSKAIIPPSNAEGWHSTLMDTWKDLSMKHEKVEAIYSALTEKGYKFETNLPVHVLPMDAEWLTHGSWDDVAKAAVKNKEEWWKLVPKEGMGKFIGGGAAIGVAVAAAGIGLYHALKPKQKPIDING